jgi:nucleotidyltransferase/DNA polymerase involved in DNA repair
LKEVRLPVTAGLANSAKLAKLATDAAKGIGFLEVPTGQEKDFLKDRPVGELSGIAKNRQRSLAALGALTFGHVAKLPSMLLKQKFGIWGQQLWLFSNGQWNEPLVLEIKDRTTISSATTLPQDERDYEAALTFMLSESTRLTGQLRREQMQAREFSVSIRFNDFTEVGTSHRFKHPQFLNSVINEVLEAMFRQIMAEHQRPVRQIRIAMFNLERLDTQPTLPVILSAEHFQWWLEPKRFEPEFLKTLLRPYPAEEMNCHKVSKLVNNAKNDVPECVCY